MANWEKLNKEFDDALNSMTKKDWKSWYERFKQKQINQNKMTAVEFLEQELDKNFEIRGNSFLFDKILKQAKEMEKEQKIEFAKMHVKTALKAVENEMILHASSVKHWYLPQNIK